MRFPELTAGSLQHLNLPKDCKGRRWTCLSGFGVQAQTGAFPWPEQVALAKVYHAQHASLSSACPLV